MFHDKKKMPRERFARHRPFFVGKLLPTKKGAPLRGAATGFCHSELIESIRFYPYFYADDFFERLMTYRYYKFQYIEIYEKSCIGLELISKNHVKTLHKNCQTFHLTLIPSCDMTKLSYHVAKFFSHHL